MIVDSIAPTLILPEVLDQFRWWQGKHHYLDVEKKYIYIFQGNVHGGENTYNTRLIDPKKFDSYWDFLEPKWKGKILAFDPKQLSTLAQRMRFFYNNPKLGPKFVLDSSAKQTWFIPEATVR